ncbi:MAG: hypothetical protein ACREOS_08285 [Candidatus Dormibacteraceae bacterium]
MGSVRTAIRTEIFSPEGAAWLAGAAVALALVAGEVGAADDDAAEEEVAGEPLAAGAEDPPPAVGAPHAASRGTERVAKPIDLSKALRVTIEFDLSFLCKLSLQAGDRDSLNEVSLGHQKSNCRRQ